jgi:predicted amidophosphoribosyltransferase
MITRLREGCRRIVSRHVLGLAPDPDTWPEPRDVGALPVPAGVDHSSDLGPAWSLDREVTPAWHRRRTVIGAQAYRFEHNGEYDCGWRLVDAAARFLSVRQPDQQFDLVALVPPPPVYAPVSVLEWSGERLARRLNLGFHPAFLAANAPVGTHPDLERHLPLPISELYRLSEPAPIRGQTLLLLDWRWHKGRTMKTIAKLLRQNGANAVCFTWLA